MITYRLALAFIALHVAISASPNQKWHKKQAKIMAKRSSNNRTGEQKIQSNSTSKLSLDETDLENPDPILARSLLPTSMEGDLLHLQQGSKVKADHDSRRNQTHEESVRRKLESKSNRAPREEALPQSIGDADVGEDGKGDTAGGDEADDGDDGSGSADEDDDDMDSVMKSKKTTSAEFSSHSSISSKKEDIQSEAFTGGKNGELLCRKRCTTPMTYHECAIPRCELKIGTIKDLCFFLCKHQHERCEDVCDDS